MVRDPILFCDAPWFDPNEVRSFPVAGYLDGNGMLPGPLSFDHILYFEWQRRCAFSLGELVRVRRRWSRGTWGARSDRTPPKARLVELVALKLRLLAGPEFLRAPFELDLWQARDDQEARYIERLLGMMDTIRGWSRWTMVDVVPMAMLWEERLLPPDYRREKKGVMPFWSDLVRFERRTRSLHGCFIGWHHREVEVLAARSLHGRYVSLPPWWGEWEMPSGFWAPLGPTLWYLGSRLMEDAGSPLWLLVVTEWVVSVAVYLVWEAHDTCRLWYCPPRTLRALRTLPLQGVLGVDGHRDLQLYLARIERTNWSQVPLSQSSRSSRTSSHHDCSPGRTGNSGDFLWIDPVTAVVVDGGSAKRSRAQVFRSGPEATEEGASDDTQPRIRRRRSGGGSDTFGSRSVQSASDVIIIDDSDSVGDDPISLVSENPVGVANEDAGGTPKDSCCVKPGASRMYCVKIGGHLRLEGDPRGSDWDIRECVQYRVRTKFLKSTIACVHVFLTEVAVPPKEGLLWDGYKLRRQILGELRHLRYRCSGLLPCRVRVLSGWPWGLMYDGEPPTTFLPPALLAVRAYLAWCFRLPLQELALSVAGLQRQLFSLLDHVRLAACCFSPSVAETIFEVRS